LAARLPALLNEGTFKIEWKLIIIIISKSVAAQDWVIYEHGHFYVYTCLTFVFLFPFSSISIILIWIGAKWNITCSTLVFPWLIDNVN
jgi:predicted Kef-type K+ transport protein